MLRSKKAYTSWEPDEKDRLIEALREHGKDWPKVKEYVSTRTSLQISGRVIKLKRSSDTPHDIKRILLGHTSKFVPRERLEWTLDEHKEFTVALTYFGKNWTRVAEYVGTRTYHQC